jgi:hypothetical protein
MAWRLVKPRDNFTFIWKDDRSCMVRRQCWGEVPSWHSSGLAEDYYLHMLGRTARNTTEIRTGFLPNKILEGRCDTDLVRYEVFVKVN